MERRQFVLASGGLLGCAGLSHARAAAGLAGARAAGPFSGATFAALAQQSFNVYDGPRGVTMQLLAVSDKHANAQLDQFSLTFAAAAGSTLKSGVYQLEHQLIGQHAVYLEACGSDARGALYRADFSLLR